jgi:hypothetical protein
LYILSGSGDDSGVRFKLGPRGKGEIPHSDYIRETCPAWYWVKPFSLLASGSSDANRRREPVSKTSAVDYCRVVCSMSWAGFPKPFPRRFPHTKKTIGSVGIENCRHGLGWEPNRQFGEPWSWGTCFSAAIIQTHPWRVYC